MRNWHVLRKQSVTTFSRSRSTFQIRKFTSQLDLIPSYKKDCLLEFSIVPINSLSDLYLKIFHMHELSYHRIYKSVSIIYIGCSCQFELKMKTAL